MIGAKITLISEIYCNKIDLRKRINTSKYLPESIQYFRCIHVLNVCFFFNVRNACSKLLHKDYCDLNV